MIFKPFFLSLFLTVIFVFFGMGSTYAAMIDSPEIKIQALNKSTARTVTIKGKVGQTIEYGSLFIKVQACRKSEPLDKPENAAFLQIWEVPVGKKKSEWAFSGWMFSSSPAVSAMDHAVYDVWVLECFDSNQAQEKPANKVIVNDVEFDDDVEIDLDIEPENDGQDTQFIDSVQDQAGQNNYPITSEIVDPNLSEEAADIIIIEAEPLKNPSDNQNNDSFDSLIEGISNFE